MTMTTVTEAVLPGETDTPIRVGEGRISAYLCFALGLLSLLGVFAFLFPSYLTTPDLRASYSPDTMRALMAAGK